VKDDSKGEEQKVEEKNTSLSNVNMTGSYLNNTDFKVTIRNLEDERSKHAQAASASASASAYNYSDKFKVFNTPHEFNVYNFDDVEYTHVTHLTSKNPTEHAHHAPAPFMIKYDDSSSSRPITTTTLNSQTKFLNTNSSSSNNANSSTNNTNMNPVNNTHSVNILNSDSDTFSSFNSTSGGVKESNLSEPNTNINIIFNGVCTQTPLPHQQQPNDSSSSLIIDLNGSRRSNATSSSCSGSSSSHASKHGKLHNLYDCNSMLEQFNNDFNSFNKFNLVATSPAPFSVNYNQKQMLQKPTSNNVELVVKDDFSANCNNDIHLLQHLLDRFENFYTTPVSGGVEGTPMTNNTNNVMFDGTRRL
jgi:hypothetical protein